MSRVIFMQRVTISLPPSFFLSLIVSRLNALHRDAILCCDYCRTLSSASWRDSWMQARIIGYSFEGASRTYKRYTWRYKKYLFNSVICVHNNKDVFSDLYIHNNTYNNIIYNNLAIFKRKVFCFVPTLIFIFIFISETSHLKFIRFI